MPEGGSTPAGQFNSINCSICRDFGSILIIEESKVWNLGFRIFDGIGEEFTCLDLGFCMVEVHCLNDCLKSTLKVWDFGGTTKSSN